MIAAPSSRIRHGLLVGLLWMATGLASPAQAPGSSSASNPTIPRSGFTVTLLQNGKVLIAGCPADDNPNPLEAELYDPATNQWHRTGKITFPRKNHTATLLADGRVLVMGGENFRGQYFTIPEIYDPAQGTWSITDKPQFARVGHTATLLKNGKVLVAGGNNSVQQGVAASAELFDPSTGKWSETGSLVVGRNQHTATLLNDGRVLVVGGAYREKRAEIYDPETGKWAFTGELMRQRTSFTATLLADGKVLIAGGMDNKSGYVCETELYDPATGKWAATGSLPINNIPTPSRDHTATLLHDGRVLLLGGINYFAKPLNRALLYIPGDGKWVSAKWVPAQPLPQPRTGHTATLLPSGKVLVLGGYSQTAPAQAELYAPGQ